MSEKYIFIIIKYPKADTAMEALSALRELMQKKIVSLKDAVAVKKTEMGEITLHQTQDDLASEGFLNGHLIGVIFADLFGSAGWDTTGALTGTAFAMLGQGIKDNLLNEFGEKMTPSESAVALLVERADWRKAVDNMRVHNFQGVIVISQNVIGDLANVEKLLDDEKIIASVPEKMEVRAPKGLKYIEGIGDVYRQKLRQAGVTNVDELLEKGSTVQGRKEIVKTAGISEKLLLRWVNMADLYRIQGIGQEYAELLEAAGVDTVPELAQRVPANLLEKMAAANAQKKMVRRLPDLSQVESWVAQAKNLPRVMTY
jgi:uncharacterized membrane protein/predicted flap endonuclease-1-like 5' DNA nuclease